MKEKLSREEVVERNCNHIVHMLKQMGEQMVRLSQTIDTYGTPLDDDQKELVRFALAPAVSECTTMMKVSLISGDLKGYDHWRCELDGLVSYIN